MTFGFVLFNKAFMDFCVLFSLIFYYYDDDAGGGGGGGGGPPQCRG